MNKIGLRLHSAVTYVFPLTIPTNSMTMQRPNALNKQFVIESLKMCLPTGESRHKGQAGRIAIIGGSLEYTGAPYYAGISAMRAGADLVHIFCASSAGIPIKCYSPDLIVHPILDSANAVDSIIPWLDRMHTVVVGPGLGREPATIKVVLDIITAVKQKNIPLIIDADGLCLLTDLKLFKDFNSPVILTPNKIEYQRLCENAGSTGLNSLGSNVMILKKGLEDEVISSHDVQWKVNLGGSSRRCGGQGDLLSGLISTFLFWTMQSKDKFDTKEDKVAMAASVSCFAASCIVRMCNEKAYEEMGIGMVASDMIKYINRSFVQFLLNKA